MGLVLVPISLSEAMLFVKRVHRHHKPPQGGLFAIAVAQQDAEEPCGVAIVGRPVARKLDDGWTAEVTRLASDGSRNACSILYSAAWRACRALGYKRLVTYILDNEPWTSLQAADFKLVGECGGGSWSRENRPRVDRHPTQKKLRWEKVVG